MMQADPHPLNTTVATLQSVMGNRAVINVTHPLKVPPFYLVREGRLFSQWGAYDIPKDGAPYQVNYIETPNRMVDVTGLPLLADTPQTPAEENTEEDADT